MSRSSKKRNQERKRRSRDTKEVNDSSAGGLDEVISESQSSMNNSTKEMKDTVNNTNGDDKASTSGDKVSEEHTEKNSTTGTFNESDVNHEAPTSSIEPVEVKEDIEKQSQNNGSNNTTTMSSSNIVLDVQIKEKTKQFSCDDGDYDQKSSSTKEISQVEHIENKINEKDVVFYNQDHNNQSSTSNAALSEVQETEIISTEISASDSDKANVFASNKKESEICEVENNKSCMKGASKHDEPSESSIQLSDLDEEKEGIDITETFHNDGEMNEACTSCYKASENQDEENNIINTKNKSYNVYDKDETPLSRNNASEINEEESNKIASANEFHDDDGNDKDTLSCNIQAEVKEEVSIPIENSTSSNEVSEFSEDKLTDVDFQSVEAESSKTVTDIQEKNRITIVTEELAPRETDDCKESTSRINESEVQKEENNKVHIRHTSFKDDNNDDSSSVKSNVLTNQEEKGNEERTKENSFNDMSNDDCSSLINKVFHNKKEQNNEKKIKYEPCDGIGNFEATTPRDLETILQNKEETHKISKSVCMTTDKVRKTKVEAIAEELVDITNRYVTRLNEKEFATIVGIIKKALVKSSKDDGIKDSKSSENVSEVIEENIRPESKGKAYSDKNTITKIVSEVHAEGSNEIQIRKTPCYDKSDNDKILPISNTLSDIRAEERQNTEMRDASYNEGDNDCDFIFRNKDLEDQIENTETAFEETSRIHSINDDITTTSYKMLQIIKEDSIEKFEDLAPNYGSADAACSLKINISEVQRGESNKVKIRDSRNKSEDQDEKIYEKKRDAYKNDDTYSRRNMVSKVQEQNDKQSLKDNSFNDNNNDKKVSEFQEEKSEKVRLQDASSNIDESPIFLHNKPKVTEEEGNDLEKPYKSFDSSDNFEKKSSHKVLPHVKENEVQIENYETYDTSSSDYRNDNAPALSRVFVEVIKRIKIQEIFERTMAIFLKKVQKRLDSDINEKDIITIIQIMQDQVSIVYDDVGSDKASESSTNMSENNESESSFYESDETSLTSTSTEESNKMKIRDTPYSTSDNNEDSKSSNQVTALHAQEENWTAISDLSYNDCQNNKVLIPNKQESEELITYASIETEKEGTLHIDTNNDTDYTASNVTEFGNENNKTIIKETTWNDDRNDEAFSTSDIITDDQKGNEIKKNIKCKSRKIDINYDDDGGVSNKTRADNEDQETEMREKKEFEVLERSINNEIDSEFVTNNLAVENLITNINEEWSNMAHASLLTSTPKNELSKSTKIANENKIVILLEELKSLVKDALYSYLTREKTSTSLHNHNDNENSEIEVSRISYNEADHDSLARNEVSKAQKEDDRASMDIKETSCIVGGHSEEASKSRQNVSPTQVEKHKEMEIKNDNNDCGNNFSTSNNKFSEAQGGEIKDLRETPDNDGFGKEVSSLDSKVTEFPEDSGRPQLGEISCIGNHKKEASGSSNIVSEEPIEVENISLEIGEYHRYEFLKKLAEELRMGEQKMSYNNGNHVKHSTLGNLMEDLRNELEYRNGLKMRDTSDYDSGDDKSSAEDQTVKEDEEANTREVRKRPNIDTDDEDISAINSKMAKVSIEGSPHHDENDNRASTSKDKMSEFQNKEERKRKKRKQRSSNESEERQNDSLNTKNILVVKEGSNRTAMVNASVYDNDDNDFCNTEKVRRARRETYKRTVARIQQETRKEKRNRLEDISRNVTVMDDLLNIDDDDTCDTKVYLQVKGRSCKLEISINVL
ncbi:hypothetical protein ABMA28_010147 [Loxostege sticticalis]|uniref:Uncharacterized protein n=1 Tax=Loxostege sticticalis TaxID=481309 RepID=A0ABD0SAK1_LOXSC